MSATCLAPVRQVIRDAVTPRWLGVVRAVERVIGAAALLLLLPALAVLAVMIRVLSRRSPLIAHLRAGQDGRPLWVLKFRTMWDGTRGSGRVGFIEHICSNGCSLKTADDPRVTSGLARFCRRHSIDELPQLLLVAAGRMSFVGPRPITVAELQTYYGEYAAEILTARPGLTGLWQIMGRNRLTYAQRLRLDLFLVRRGCVWLYIRVLLKTVPRVFSGRGAW